MFDELNYILWYHKVLGKTQKGRKALEHYGSYEKLYDALVGGYERTGLLKNAPERKYTSFSLIDAEKVIVDCEENGWHIIPCTSHEYPEALLETKDYPHILFCDGMKEILSGSPMFAVVGSRDASAENERIVYNMAYNLAGTGAVVVSGAALGIDSAAHLGAVKAGGHTVGVLGCGLGDSYMDRIGEFYDEVKASGIYITEMFPFEGVTRSSFPDRNRLISGLSRAVLVACASENSGTLNTAAHAKKQKRKIFVPDKSLISSNGCDLLLAEGAEVFENAGSMAYMFRNFYDEKLFNEEYCNKSCMASETSEIEIISALPVKKQEKNIAEKKEIRSENNSAPKRQITALPSYFSDTAKQIYDILSEGLADIQELIVRTECDIVEVQIALSELEAEGFVRCSSGGQAERL